jgi:hypothetical protein
LVAQLEPLLYIRCQPVFSSLHFQNGASQTLALSGIGQRLRVASNHTLHKPQEYLISCLHKPQEEGLTHRLMNLGVLEAGCCASRPVSHASWLDASFLFKFIFYIYLHFSLPAEEERGERKGNRSEKTQTISPSSGHML